MQTRFLLGPSGTGKTFQCLAEARSELLASPEGPPLLFLAPKQATFQLERQLLEGAGLNGYTRLQILSFERLAKFILGEFGGASPPWLSDEGRLMVLRAILTGKKADLEIFHATARLPGFAQELGAVIREFMRAQVSPGKLRAVAQQVGPAHCLDAKLRDLAMLFENYLRWLDDHQLEDQDRLLSLAAGVLRVHHDNRARANESAKTGALPPESFRVLQPPVGASAIWIGRLWMDGFAEMSVQEIELLVALLPLCGRATLAFNLDSGVLAEDSWTNPWGVVAQTFGQLRRRLEARPDIEVTVQCLERGAGQRFSTNPVLRHLENHWSKPAPFASNLNKDEPSRAELSAAIRIVITPNPEFEAVAAAREIRRFVRSGGRFREVAVLARNLDSYADPIRRAFTTCQIPFFLDRRETAAHHPLAELTRSALRTIAFQWRTEDWFAALKTALVYDNEMELDRLENEALARGWTGKQWERSLEIPDNSDLENWIESLRQRLVAPFQKLALALGLNPSGQDLAEALQEFWRALAVEQKLERWAADSGNVFHITFGQQMHSWLENLSRAFPSERLPIRQWLPIIEAGLANQTVGAIPPALDQVLIGTVDRSRNPNLRLVIVLGMNESVFPANPSAPVLLTESDRARLREAKVELTYPMRTRLGYERYLGYVGLTRATQRLVLTCSLRNEDDKPLNPSSFITHLRRLFPQLEPDFACLQPVVQEVEHANDLLELLLESNLKGREQTQALAPFGRNKVVNAVAHRLRHFPDCAPDHFSAALAEKLYGRALSTSVTGLESFAACPFKFFVYSGLRAEERRRYEWDAREQGSFQHELLASFHRSLDDDDRRWRDITADEARERMASVAEDLKAKYRGGLVLRDDRTRFVARCIISALQDLVETLVDWMGQYKFDPRAVELGFGQKGDRLPAWRLDLDPQHQFVFRGKIDRVDLFRAAESDETACIVIDYKTTPRKLDDLLMDEGVQIQLAAYLNALRALPEAATFFETKRLVPAGVFYIGLRGSYQQGKTRDAVIGDRKDARKLAYKHAGRFDTAFLGQLDCRGARSGDQFTYSITQNGELSQRSREALSTGAFLRMLDRTNEQLLGMGRRIYAGEASIDPYQKGHNLACNQCHYQGICRIDPWTHRYRVLRPARGAKSI